ncbi:FAD-dependent oxidoreductase [Desulfofundulus thermobenzoicus]|uniref:FAD-dependent oxidoreductase n=1 Tax=Desulfofundulus thermobenzoicus TaxID=29376 RepID=A0A6N7IV63_9FIRM|nr:FAD-dependent oxidoreductase [Desulfofundulus thermobenzoicus]MQL53433.1 FAD-dependent oxidoreductase [Desulfofundulus thermobenzoicus]
MGEDKFTAIVIGAGPAGSTAAYLLAREGLDVLLIEKGDTPGGKNMFGGRMYSHALNRIIPNFWEEAPVQRPVVREVITFLTEDRSLSFVCQDESWNRSPYHSFTLLRAEFDAWLASKAEEAGAELACGIRVDDLVMEKGRVVGVRAGEDELLADVVIAADGVNSLMAQKAGLRKELEPHQVATGVKEVIELPAEVISQRFQVADNGGTAQLFVGSCTCGMQGGGFLYTNKNSISLGLVVSASELQQNPYRPVDLMEDFKAHPHIAPLIEGGEVVEYSAHLVPEAGLEMVPGLYGDGIVVVGDAAGFVLNLGYQVRGMDLAIASGEAAARAVKEARAKNDFSRQSLAVYQEYLKRDFVFKDLEAYRKAPAFLKNKRLYTIYPQLATGLFSRVFSVNGTMPVHLLHIVLHQLKQNQVGWLQLAGDAWKGGRSL